MQRKQVIDRLSIYWDSQTIINTYFTLIYYTKRYFNSLFNNRYLHYKEDTLNPEQIHIHLQGVDNTSKFDIYKSAGNHRYDPLFILFYNTYNNSWRRLVNDYKVNLSRIYRRRYHYHYRCLCYSICSFRCILSIYILICPLFSQVKYPGINRIRITHQLHILTDSY